jgi:hypothetical protein
MSENLIKLVNSSKVMIELAKNMMLSCQLEKERVYSEAKFVMSFFLRRSWEMFESLIILINEDRIIESALLLRSQLEMGFSLGYIFAAGIDENENEVRALIYHLDGNRNQLALINSNLDGFKELDPNIETRRDELAKQNEQIKSYLRNKYGQDNWSLPNIEERAKQSGSDVLKSAYSQSYRDLSNIEHHTMLFGEHYVDEERCEPMDNVDHQKHYSQLKITVSLFLFRIVFIEILHIFNQLFKLNMAEKITEIRKIQDEDSKLLAD